MPLIAYKSAHGANDYPLHFAFFGELEARGLLDRFTFALDPLIDPNYCALLIARFPQLTLTTDHHLSRRALHLLADTVGRGYRPLSFNGHFDAVFEACGGRLNPIYARDTWRIYPRTRKRAIMFHSVEKGLEQMPVMREALQQTDLLIARTQASAARAKALGVKRVVTSSDIAFSQPACATRHAPGIAAALRVPDRDVTDDYLGELRAILRMLEAKPTAVDLVQPEAPIGAETRRRGYGTGALANVHLWHGDTMYEPFCYRRDLVISCRLHTSLLALIYGTRRLIQFQIEDSSSKIREIFEDIGLGEIVVHTRAEMTLKDMTRLVDEAPALDDQVVQQALQRGADLVRHGMDEVEAFMHALESP